MSMETIKTECMAELAVVENAEQLSAFWAKYLGKGGEVQKLMNGIKNVPNEEKKAYGQAVNEVKNWVQVSGCKFPATLSFTGSVTSTFSSS